MTSSTPRRKKKACYSILHNLITPFAKLHDHAWLMRTFEDSEGETNILSLIREIPVHVFPTLCRNFLPIPVASLLPNVFAIHGEQNLGFSGIPVGSTALIQVKLDKGCRGLHKSMLQD